MCGQGCTFPAGGEGQVLHPGHQAGQHLVLQAARARAGQLPRHHLHTQGLAHVRMIPVDMHIWRVRAPTTMASSRDTCGADIAASWDGSTICFLCNSMRRVK